MNDLRITQMIVTELVTRGGDKQSQQDGQCCRRITQYWDMKGQLCFEYDPCPGLEKNGKWPEPKLTFYRHPSPSDLKQ